MSHDGTEIEEGSLPLRRDKVLTEQEVQAFLTRVGARDACPVCTNSRWYMASSDKFRHFVPAITQVFGRQIGVSVYVMICTKCGFVRQHFAGIVDGTVESGPNTANRERDRAEER